MKSDKLFEEEVKHLMKNFIDYLLEYPSAMLRWMSIDATLQDVEKEYRRLLRISDSLWENPEVKLWRETAKKLNTSKG